MRGYAVKLPEGLMLTVPAVREDPQDVDTPSDYHPGSVATQAQW